MKKKLFIIIELFVIFCLLTSCNSKEIEDIIDVKNSRNNPVINQDNLIMNGNFDNNFDNWKVVDFTSGAQTNIYSDNDNNTVRFFHNNIHDWNAVGQEIRTKLISGQEYMLTFRYKILNISDCESPFRIAFADEDLVMHSTNLYVAQLAPLNKWIYVRHNFVVTDNFPKSSEPFIDICFDYNVSGEFLIDDILIKKK